jgi:hypothetical protein
MAARRGGELDRMPVLEVGTGVGYFRAMPLPMFWRLTGRGKAGDEESGSERLEPAGCDRGRLLDGEVKVKEALTGSVGSLEERFEREGESIAAVVEELDGQVQN